MLFSLLPESSLNLYALYLIELAALKIRIALLLELYCLDNMVTLKCFTFLLGWGFFVGFLVDQPFFGLYVYSLYTLFCVNEIFMPFAYQKY